MSHLLPFPWGSYSLSLHYGNPGGHTRIFSLRPWSSFLMTWRTLLGVLQVHHGGWVGHRHHWRPLGARKRLYTTSDSFKTAVFEPFDVRVLFSGSGGPGSVWRDAGTIREVGPTIDTTFSLKEFAHIFILGLLRAILVKTRRCGWTPVNSRICEETQIIAPFIIIYPF